MRDKKSKCSSGFTLIEMVIIFGILAIISATLIISLHTGEQQIVLFKEQARIVSVISRAKSLSITTFGEAGVPCGFGVHFEAPSTFLIFKDLAPDCSAADNKYSGNSANNCEEEPECVEKFNLDSTRVVFDKVDLTDIDFIPPNPTVIITPDQSEATIDLRTVNGNNSVKIKVNSAGQISTE